MFDDQQPSVSTPPQNLPTEPVDMFSDVEKDETIAPAPDATPNAISAGFLKKKTAPQDASMPSTMAQSSARPNTVATPPVSYDMKQPLLGKVLLFLLLAVVLGGMGFGVWVAYNKFLNKDSADVAKETTTSPAEPTTAQEEAVIPEEIVTETPVPEEEIKTNEETADVVSEMNNDKILFGQMTDSDKDGLDDERERQLGLDPFKADFDSDGLSDGDEILWKTDPKDIDTDNDSYSDGSEIRNGYNPLGVGKIQWSTAPTTTPATATSAVQ